MNLFLSQYFYNLRMINKGKQQERNENSTIRNDDVESLHVEKDAEVCGSGACFFERGIAYPRRSSIMYIALEFDTFFNY